MRGKDGLLMVDFSLSKNVPDFTSLFWNSGAGGLARTSRLSQTEPGHVDRLLIQRSNELS
jgi:hypothetical protein